VQTTSSRKTPTQILISGAGPSGLLLALLLAQRNIPSLVLEAWPGLDTRLRATQYGVPATRVFRRAGILDDIRAASIESFPTICWRRVADGGSKLVQVDMSCIADHPDRMTILQLGHIIQIMYRHCIERGKGLIDVRFRHRVVSVGQDAEKAWADVEVGEEKEMKRFEADYVIGCDGATSAVRRSLFGREWPGQTFDYRFIVQNVCPAW
jgi:2-polyprenyl-6-methoxyphenol hydroxylase-like FAD-dependent oxidoreductase